MKRTWLMMIVAAALAILVSAGTFALFTASTGPANATITAGTLHLVGDRDQGDTVPGPMFYTTVAEGNAQGPSGDSLYPTGLWAPGDFHVRVFQIENDGSLDALLKTVSATLESSDNALPDILYVDISESGTPGVLASGSLRQFLTAPQSLGDIEMAPGDMVSLEFRVNMPLSAGNAYQGLPLKVSFSVYAEQAAHNP